MQRSCRQSLKAIEMRVQRKAWREMLDLLFGGVISEKDLQTTARRLSVAWCIFLNGL